MPSEQNGTHSTSFCNTQQCCDPLCLLERGFRASGPKLEKNRKHIGFGRPRKYEKISRKMANFPIFRQIFPIFWGRPKPIFFLYFSYFRPEARKPRSASRQGRNCVLMCKWTWPFWGTDCRRSLKSLSSAQAASLCSAGIERALRKCLQGEHFVRCCHDTHGLLFRGLPGRANSSLQPDTHKGAHTEVLKPGGGP